MVVTGFKLRLKYTGLCIGIVYIFSRAAHNAIAMEVEDWGDRRQWQARERVQRYRRQVTAQQIDEKKNDKIMVTGDNLLISI